MSAKRNRIPQYGTVEINGHTYYRTMVTDAEGNRISLYAKTLTELYDKEMDAWEQIENNRIRKNSPTVANYCENWLKTQAVHIRATTLADYTSKIKRYMRGNIQYYRTRILDADGKQVALYAATPEELYKKERRARKEVAEIIFRNNNPTVADYCEKWLLMKSATISASTLKNYTSAVNKYIIKPLGDMYLSEVTTDDLLLALAPVANMSERMYDQVNMLLKCIFTSAENNHLIDYNPAVKVPAGGGKPTKKKEVLTDE